MPQMTKAEYAMGFRPRRDSTTSNDGARRDSVSEDSARERRESFTRTRSTSISEEPISPISSSPPSTTGGRIFNFRRGIVPQPASEGKIMNKILSQNFAKTTKNFDKINSEW